MATTVADATDFLYTGPDAVQFGIAPDTIEPVRAAVVRRKAETRDGSPLAGVCITVLDHPEFGFTAGRQRDGHSFFEELKIQNEAMNAEATQEGAHTILSGFSTQSKPSYKSLALVRA